MPQLGLNLRDTNEIMSAGEVNVWRRLLAAPGASSEGDILGVIHATSWAIGAGTRTTPFVKYALIKEGRPQIVQSQTRHDVEMGGDNVRNLAVVARRECWSSLKYLKARYDQTLSRPTREMRSALHVILPGAIITIPDLAGVALKHIFGETPEMREQHRFARDAFLHKAEMFGHLTVNPATSTHEALKQAGVIDDALARFQPIWQALLPYGCDCSLAPAPAPPPAPSSMIFA